MPRRRETLAALAVLGSGGCLRLTEQGSGGDDGGPDTTEAAIDPGEIGEERWTFDAKAPFQNAGVAVDDSYAFAASDDETLYALSLDSGEVEWTYSEDNWPPHATFTPAGSHVFLVVNSGTVALDADTGEERWRTEEAVAVQRSPPLVVDDRVYVHGGSRTPADSGVVELDRETGEMAWRFETDGRTLAAPAVADDTLLMSVNPHGGAPRGRLFGIDTATGEERWRIDREKTLGGIEVANGTAYASGENGPLLAFDPQTGDVLWETDDESLMNNNLSGGSVVTTQAHTFDDRLFFSGEYLLEYDRENGDFLGQIDAVEEPAPLFHRREELYAISAVHQDGGLYSIDTDNGSAERLLAVNTETSQAKFGTFDTTDHTLCIAEGSTLRAVWYAE